MSPRRRQTALNKQQRRILDAIHFFLAKGEIPTVREVGGLVGLRSPATVWKHLRALEAARLISMNGKSRGIRLTDDGWALFQPTAASGTRDPVEGTADARQVAHRVSGRPGRSHRGIAAVTWRGILRAARTGQGAREPEASGDSGSAGVLPFPSGDSGRSGGSAGPAGTVSPGGTVPVVGAIAAGRPFESYSDGFFRGSTGSGASRFGSPGVPGSSGPPRPWGFREGPVGPGQLGDARLLDAERRRAAERDAILGDELEGAEGIAGLEGDVLGEVLGGGLGESPHESPGESSGEMSAVDLPIDPGLFVDSGEVFALRIEGDSMVNAGILDGDFVIIRRQNTVEEGEIAAVLIDGEGTLKRWHARRTGLGRTSLEGSSQGDPYGDDPSDHERVHHERVHHERVHHEQSDQERARAGGSDEWPELVAPGDQGFRPPGERPSARCVRLDPANERFEPIYVSEEDGRDVLVFGKYVGLVRGSVRFA